MSNPVDIPDDVRVAAWNAAGHVYDPSESKGAHSYVTDIIARAIMAERERCAKLVENDARLSTPIGRAVAHRIREPKPS